MGTTRLIHTTGVAAVERSGAPARGVLPLGAVEIDRALGEGGLRLAALHEASGPAADGFAAMLAGRIAARTGGAVLWCMRGRADLYPPALPALGLDPARLVLVRCRGRAAVPAAMEEAMRCPGLAAVVAEMDRPPGMIAGRRLQLAAEAGGVTGLVLLRRGATSHGATSRDATRRHGANAPGAMAPSAAVSRWRVDPAPGGAGIRWQLTLLRCRGGGVGAWKVEWDEKTHRLAVVSQTGD
jgi:protein ImuA